MTLRNRVQGRLAGLGLAGVRIRPKPQLGARFLALALGLAGMAWGQPGGSTLSGVIVTASGTAVPHATVAVKNVASGKSATAQTDTAGKYTVTGLDPGEYVVSVAAPGAGSATGRATLGDAPGALNLTLAQVPAGVSKAPSLADLGFAPDQSQGSAQDQARLDRRSHMLKIHQRLGLITLAPLAATLIASGGAAGHGAGASGRELHGALGAITAGMYLTTASFAIRAPKIAGTKTRGPITIHKALAFIHGPGMILTPILGALAYHQRSSGQKVHGIASAHGAVAAVTGIAYGAALLSVSIKF